MPKEADQPASEGHIPERERARRRLYGYLTRRGFRGKALREGIEGAQRRL